MALTPTVFRSTDPGMPSITGQNGTGYQACKQLLLALGWTLTYEYPSGERGVLRNDPVSGTGYHLEFIDTASGAGGAKEMLVYAWESYDAATQVGTNRVPTSVQLSAGTMWHKSFAASSTARPWIALGTERDFYLGIDSNSNGERGWMHALDVRSFKPADQHSFAVAGGLTQNVANNVQRSTALTVGGAMSSPVQGTARQFVGRNSAATIGAIEVSAIAPTAGGNIGQFVGATGAAYPFTVSNGLLFERYVLLEAANTPRGFLPGLYVPLHARPLGDDSQVTSVPEISGGTLLALNGRASAVAGSQGQVLFDITNAW